MSRKVYLCRHGEYDKARKFEINPLTERGIIQARRLGGYFSGLQGIGLLSSTSMRSLQSTRVVADVIGFDFGSGPCFASPQLKEKPNILHDGLEGVYANLFLQAVQRLNSEVVIAVLHANLNLGIARVFGCPEYWTMGHCDFYEFNFYSTLRYVRHVANSEM